MCNDIGGLYDSINNTDYNTSTHTAEILREAPQETDT